MNKIKVLYDVVKVMRDKEAYNGVIEAAVSKDEVQVAQFTNEFSKDLAGGSTRARITSVVDHHGRQLKHESTTEFSQKDENRRGAFGHCGHFHGRLRHGHFNREAAGRHGPGLKGRLDWLLAVLNALNNLKVDEQADKSLLLSLDLTDIPEELQSNIKERFGHRQHGPNLGLKELHSIEKGTLECKVNPKNEVETLALKMNGKILGESDETHEVSCQAEIRFSW